MIRRNVAEPDDGGWLVAFHDGRVRWFPTAEEVLNHVRARDAKAGRTVFSNITWRNVPEGFRPPGSVAS